MNDNHRAVELLFIASLAWVRVLDASSGVPQKEQLVRKRKLTLKTKLLPAAWAKLPVNTEDPDV